MRVNPACEVEARPHPDYRLSTVWVGDTTACATHPDLLAAMIRHLLSGAR